MQCKKCGKTLQKQEIFCTLCGYYNDPNENEDNLEQVTLNSKTQDLIDNYNHKEIYENEKNFKNRCLKEYLSQDYEKTINKKFSLYAMIFSWIYFIYKKIYIIGIIGLLITSILLLYQRLLLIIFVIISMLGSGLFFNKIYLWISNSKVDKIIEKNKQKSPKEIIRISKKAGKENILITLSIYFVFLLGTLFLYLYVVQNNSFNDKFWKENGSTKATCISMIETAKGISNSNGTSFLIEAGCIVEDSGLEKYHLYLKFEQNGKVIFEKFRTEERNMYFVETTEPLNDYETKKIREGLNESETKYYQEMLNIKEEYSQIVSKSKQEEEQINKNMNTTARKYFLLTKEEINR